MQHQNRAPGFTFVEILIAVLILASGVLVFTGVMTATSSQSRAGGAATQAPLLASHILETIKGELKTGTHPQCGATTHTHQRSGVTYTENRTITALALDEAAGVLDTTDCNAAPIHAYEISIELHWSGDGVDRSSAHGETVSLAEHTPPRIDKFEVDTNLILTPQDPNANLVTFTWDIPVGGQPLDVRITSTSGHDEQGLAHRDSLSLHITRSAVFTITATNPAGTHERQLTVYAIDLSIDDFVGVPPIVGPQEPVMLAWNTDATPDPRFHTVRLQPLDVDVTALSSYDIPSGISATTSYTLEIFTNHASGMLIDTLDTSVLFSSTPVVHDLTYDPSVQCAPGGGVSIAWDVSAGYRVELDSGASSTLLHEGGSGPGSEIVSAAPPGTHTWDVVFTNRVGGATTQSITLTSTALPVITQSLAPNPAVAGVEVVHAWNIDPATSATLNGAPIPLSGSNAFRAMPGVTPTTYEIHAHHDGCEPTPNPHTLSLNIEPITLSNVTLSTTHTAPAPGELVTIAWDYTNTFSSSYHRVRIVDQNNHTHYSGSASEASFALPSHGSYTFTVRLETTEASPRLLHSVTLDPLTVLLLPIATSLTLPNSACATSGITAAWTTEHATSATINGGTVTPTASGSRTYNPPHPSGQRDFALVATNAGGRTDDRSGSVTIQSPPSIDSFTISNPTPAAGESVTLSWSVSHASTVTLNGAPVSASGSVTRLILNNDPFELRAEPISPCPNSQRATQTITPNTVMPSISSFTGTSPILRGQSSTLSASLSNFNTTYQAARILAPVNRTYTTSNISQSVTPNSTTTYTLRITSKNGGHILASRNTTVTVNVPTISVLTNAFGYNNPAFNGEPHGIRYVLQNFNNGLHRFTITGGGRTTSPTSSSGQWIVPGSNTRNSAVTYTATIRQRSNNSLLASRSYTINVRPAPDVNFYRTPTSATAPGSGIRVYWSHNSNWSNSFHRSVISASGTSNYNATTSSGNRWYYPNSTTTYYLRIYRRSDNTLLRTRSFTHTVQPPPTINSFTTSSTHLCSGSESVTLSWNTSNATTVRLYNSRDGSTTTVSANGNRTLTASSSGFVRLTASNAVDSVQDQINFTSAAVSGSLSISPTTVAANQSFTLSWNSSGTTTRSLTSVHPVQPSGTASRSRNSGGTYTYTFQGSNTHSCSFSVSRQVTVTDPPILNVRHRHTATSVKYPGAPSFTYFNTQGTLLSDPGNTTSHHISGVPQNRPHITIDYALQSMGVRMNASAHIGGWAVSNDMVSGTMQLNRDQYHTVQLRSATGSFGCTVGSDNYSSDRFFSTPVRFRYNGSTLRVTMPTGSGYLFIGACNDSIYHHFYRLNISVR